MNISIYVWTLALGALFGWTAEARAQEERPLTLEEAVAEAVRNAPDVKAARARADAASHGAGAAGSFLWPTVGLEAGAVRSNDPVAAFGGRLRQARFTQQDFDPAALNRPDPLTDWSGAAGASWAPLDLSAVAGRDAAVREADAARMGADWAARAAAFRAEARYLEAAGAEQRLAAAALALESARANLDVTRRRRDAGVLTDADALQARAALESARTRRIDAARGVADARDRLAVALGWPAGVVPVPVDTAFSLPETLGEPVADLHMSRRADLKASRATVEAAEARVSQARRARLPTVEGFARLETHSARAFSGIEDDWTVGFRLRVPLFTGFEVARRERAARSLREAAEHDHGLRVRRARAEVDGARRALAAARQGAQAAEAGTRAAREAARLVRRRFEEGLTTTADLLAAEARAAEMNTAAVDARLALRLAGARLAFLTDTTTDDLSGGMDR